VFFLLTVFVAAMPVCEPGVTGGWKIQLQATETES
jgi:hypothetical protein